MTAKENQVDMTAKENQVDMTAQENQVDMTAHVEETGNSDVEVPVEEAAHI